MIIMAMFVFAISGLLLFYIFVFVDFVVNNDGGGIFSFLPVRNETDVFEPFFGTPHGLTLEHAASMYGLSYSNPKDMEAFKAIYNEATKQAESIIIELVTDRSENHRFHHQIFESLRESS